MRNIIKWTGLLLALVVLVSLFFYVREKKERPVVSSDELLKKAIVAMRDRHAYADAIILCRKALQQSPGYADVAAVLGRAYQLSDRLDSARKYLDRAIATEPGNIDALLYLANISLQQKDTVSAISYLVKLNNAHPKEREPWLNRYGLELATRKYVPAAETYLAYLKNFRKDSIQAISFDYWYAEGEARRKNNEWMPAYAAYKKAIIYRSSDTASLQQLVNLSVAGGNNDAALRYNNRLLSLYPSSAQYLNNESSIRQKKGDIDSATQYAAKVYELDKENLLAKKNLAELYLLQAKDADTEQKIAVALQAIELTPVNKQAWIYLINGYSEQKKYAEALRAVDHALQYLPSDEDLVDRKIGVLYDTGDYAACLAYIDIVLQRKPTRKNIRTYDEVALKEAMRLIGDRNWPGAQTVIEKGLAYNSSSRLLLETLINVYASQKNDMAALAVTDRLLKIDPANEYYRFKKAGLLETMHRYTEALTITRLLLEKDPANYFYREAYRQQLLGAEKESIREKNWNMALQWYYQQRIVDTPSYYSIGYAITAYNELKDTVGFLQVTDTALKYYPGDSLLLVKHSLALTANSMYPSGLAITRDLLQRYPSDTSLQLVYLDQLNGAGKYYERNDRNTEAIAKFLTAHAAAPRDTFALMNLSAIYFVKKQYDSSIYYADKGLVVDGNNTYLLMKKASAHEQLKQYAAAYQSAKKIQQLSPSPAIRDYTDYLQNKTLLNQFGITHLHSFFSSASSQFASVTGIQYMRRFDKGSVTGHLNYGDRSPGSGWQAGAEIYYNHDSSYYSNAFLYGSTGKAFPYWQGGYSLFRNFRKGWEGELGARYIGFDSIHNYSIVGSVGKYFGNTWLNARAYATYNTRDWFQSYTLTVRRYLNDKSDYISLVGGLGNVPDDQSLNLNLNNFAGLKSKSIGAGFQKTFRYKTSLQMFFTYNRLKITPVTSVNQYDIYLTLLRNF